MNTRHNFLKREDGGFAIEYAMTFPFFLILVFGFFEICLYAYSSASMQRSLEDTVYDLRTGHAFAELGNQDPEAYLKQKICDKMYVAGCSDSINVQVQKFDTSFDLFEDSEDTGNIDLGASSIVMRVQADVRMPTAFTLGPALSIFGYQPLFADQDDIRVGSGLTFMTEPY